MKNIAIFASGSGSNAENIAHYFAHNNAANVSLIISNNENAFVHQRAKNIGVKSFTFSNQEFKNSDAVSELLREYHIDFIVLAGFLIKVSKELIEAYPNAIVNIHPALLPNYGGKGMYGDKVHQAVIDAKEKESGITIHYVNEKYDEGNIIFQAKCGVEEHDTPHSLADKVHQLEYRYYPEVIGQLLE